MSEKMTGRRGTVCIHGAGRQREVAKQRCGGACGGDTGISRAAARAAAGAVCPVAHPGFELRQVGGPSAQLERRQNLKQLPWQAHPVSLPRRATWQRIREHFSPAHKIHAVTIVACCRPPGQVPQLLRRGVTGSTGGRRTGGWGCRPHARMTERLGHVTGRGRRHCLFIQMMFF